MFFDFSYQKPLEKGLLRFKVDGRYYSRQAVNDSDKESGTQPGIRPRSEL